jgi:hypothetical protein
MAISGQYNDLTEVVKLRTTTIFAMTCNLSLIIQLIADSVGRGHCPKNHELAQRRISCQSIFIWALVFYLGDGL